VRFSLIRERKFGTENCLPTLAEEDDPGDVMTLRFEQIFAEGVAQSSHLIGDDAAGTAAIVDPRPDVEVYLQLAQHYGLTITHVFEAHISAPCRTFT
jgi:hypothetical protein